MLMAKGHALIFGPVFDPKGAYGIAIVGVHSEEDLTGFIKPDPATSINAYEYYPLMAIVPDTVCCFPGFCSGF
jgi:hypothetical protein